MQELTASALLFDLDGTLINSLPSVERSWRKFAARHGLDPETIMDKIHGRRSIDSIRQLLPNVDAESEDMFIRAMETSDTVGVIALPGTLFFLDELPSERWAVVTSGTSDVAMARCRAAGLPRAGVYVFGEDVANGKPAPDPFLLAAKRLGIAPEDCVGFEDTEAGLRSIVAAGVQPVSIGLPGEYSVKDLTEVQAKVENVKVVLTFSGNSSLR